MVSRLCWILLWGSAAPAARPRPRFRVKNTSGKTCKNTHKLKKKHKKHTKLSLEPPLAALCHKNIPERPQRQPRRAKGTQKGDTRTPKRPQRIPKGGQRAPEASQKAQKSDKKMEKEGMTKTSKTNHLLEMLKMTKKSKKCWSIPPKMSSHAGNSASSKGLAKSRKNMKK